MTSYESKSCLHLTGVITMSLSTAFYTGPLPYSFINYLCIYNIHNHYWNQNYCWWHQNIVNGWGHWQPELIVLLSIASSNGITHCGPVTPYLDASLGPLWLQYWLDATRQHATAWANVDKSSVSPLGNSIFRNAFSISKNEYLFLIWFTKW